MNQSGTGKDSNDPNSHESLIRAWEIHEEKFKQNLYDGLASNSTVLHIPPREETNCYIVAGHSVNHFRDGQIKYADRGTGGLAQLLADLTGCGVLVSTYSKNSDSNFDADHPIKTLIRQLAPSWVIDLHGMKNHGNSPDIDIGLGTGLNPGEFIESLTSNSALKISINSIFDANRENTVTRYCQNLYIPACQIEISANCRPPLGNESLMRETLMALASSISLLK